MKIESVLAIANKENLNGRVYSTELFNDMLRQFEDKKPMYGELGRPSEPVVSLKNASHKIVSVRIKKSRLPRKNKKHLKKQGLYENWKNNNGPILFGTIELIDTKVGELAKKMFENKTAVVRSRGFGNVNGGEIQDYSLISFDVIHKDDDSFKGLM